MAVQLSAVDHDLRFHDGFTPAFDCSKRRPTLGQAYTCGPAISHEVVDIRVSHWTLPFIEESTGGV